MAERRCGTLGMLLPPGFARPCDRSQSAASQRLINEYVLYYLEDRTHLALEKGTPAGREAKEDPGAARQVISMPRLGGLHHRYNRAA